MPEPHEIAEGRAAAAQPHPSRDLADRSFCGGRRRDGADTFRVVASWISSIGLDPGYSECARWANATLMYRRMGNLRAVQLLLCHTKIESTVRYLGIEVDDAIAIAEQIDV